MVSLCVVCRVAEVGKLSRTQRRQERRVTRNLCPLMLKYPPLGPLLRLRTPTISESTSSAFSDFGATSPSTNLETAVESEGNRRRGRLCWRHALPHLPTAERQPGQLRPRWRLSATTTSAGRKETSPLWQRQAPALYLPFAHAFASTAARVRMRPRPRNERRGLGICKPYQGTEYALSAGD